MHGWRAVSTYVMLAAVLAGCAPRRAARDPAPAEPAGAPASAEEPQPPPGVFHRIRPGQTLYTIARTYGVELAAVIAANRIPDPDRIEAGDTLFIPGVPEALDVPPTALPGTPNRFLAPVEAPLNSPFGPRHGRMHYGVDLGAPAGAPVHAARAGTVSYAGNGYRGYGNLIILDHEDGYQTLYAHNRRLLARKGRRVQSGEVIARVGGTGNATAPHLHFEIRKDGVPLDPARFVSF